MNESAEEPIPSQPQSPDELLLALVEAERRIQPNARSFAASGSIGPHGVRIAHPGLPNTFRARARADVEVEALADEKRVRVRTRNGAQIVFDLTDAGRKHARLPDAVEAPAGGAVANGHPLDWATVRRLRPL